ncbi:hypothetical protein [Paraburkholderia caffeinilytica]|uniref:Uncharacterized protein n=1 Tax=Paraburkholderia caffeinilytica TaxID=1761016 RepID=A0ABQ1NFJ3_9BURK|nr:hypothetical protein [Paraburkholderia caffeinilytica]GGC67307.1 hypothetical protein GCM10011400_64040 [Paraburkholderia caffeinilytica]CAB3804187.1 hypothetical protein LMG28690_05963 [Paraburkholderia caffeinilytica]
MDWAKFFYSYRDHVICCRAVRRDSGAFRAIAEIARFYCDIPIIVEHSPHNVLFLTSDQSIFYMLRRAEYLIDDALKGISDPEKVAFSK